MKDKVIEIIGRSLDINPDEIEMYSHIENDLGADDLDFVELMMSLEEELQIEVNDAIAETWRTVKDVVEYFNARA